MMRYCTRCIQPDTRPEVIFHDDGVCAACRNFDERRDINWDIRKKEIEQISQWAKEISGNYDCVVGVSGGKDSTVQALYARDVLGLRVLLVNAVPVEITSVGRTNLENLIQMGFDIISIQPNPVIVKQTMKDAFYKFGNPLKTTEYYLWSSAYRVAINYKIPLVIQGDVPGTTGVKRFVDNGDAIQALKGNTINDDVSIWVSEKVNRNDLYFWEKPSFNEIEASGIRAVYLSYYVPEWSNINNTIFSVQKGLKGRENHLPEETGLLNPFTQIDIDFLPVNDLLKYLKFGFGGVNGELCNLLRSGFTEPEHLAKLPYNIGVDKLTRENAIKIVEKYDGRCNSKYIKKLCNYLGISMEDFWNHVDNNIVNEKLFKKDPNTGRWIPKFKVGVGLIE